MGLSKIILVLVIALIAWMFYKKFVSDAQRLVKDFRVERHGAPLFFPNSEEWRRKHPR